MKHLILIFFLFVTIGGFAQGRSSASVKDNCTDERIKTVRLYKSGNENAEPVIAMNTSESLVLLFDDLSNEQRRYYYTFTHCNADWMQDALVTNDFLTGFPENPITMFEYSLNTSIKYTNYRVNFPSGDMRFKLSGNYLIKVFDEATRELVLQKGFSVVEYSATIAAKFRSASMGGQNCNQQIDFSVNHPSLLINDAFVNLKVRVEQNSVRLSNTSNPVPAFTNTGSTDYTRPDKNIYPGNNEYRAFDIRNLSFTGMGVNNIQIIQGTYRVLLNDDYSKEHTRYSLIKDNNGRYVIGADRARNMNTESDYVEAFFTLQAKMPILDGKVYLFGELTNWQIDDRYEMNYDPVAETYQKDLFLKQGYYNYRYVVVRNNGNIDILPFEGCFSETENLYTIYVYYNKPGENFDRLVGVQRLNSQGIL